MVMKTFYTAVKNNIMNITKNNYPKIPDDHVSIKVSI